MMVFDFHLSWHRNIIRRLNMQRLIPTNSFIMTTATEFHSSLGLFILKQQQTSNCLMASPVWCSCSID